MKYTLIAGLLIAAAPVFAEDEHREMDEHVHGVSELKIAIDGDNIAMDIMAPGMDITGFEYEPESDEDHAAVEAAILQLGNPKGLFTMNEDAECHVTEVFAHRHGADHEHEEDMHDEHDEPESDEDHEHDEHDQEGAGHSAFHAKYQYDCHNVGALTAMELPYFNVFENAQEVEIELVSDQGAKVIEVPRENTTMQLN